MYPLPDQTLCLVDIARYWAPELAGMSENGILDKLMSAFWRGQLHAFVLPSHASDSHAEREKLLRMVANAPDHPGLLFVPEGQEPPPIVVDLPDGGALVDKRKHVIWPPRDQDDAPSVANDAFEDLASASLSDYSIDARVILFNLEVDRREFELFCNAFAFARPAFWFGTLDKLSPAQRVAACTVWMRRKVDQGVKPQSKSQFLKDAQDRFPGLSVAEFHRIWDEVTPPEWRRPGAPKRGPGSRRISGNRSGTR